MNKRLVSLMLKSALTRKAAPKVGLATLKLQKVSPEIYLAGGIAAGVVSAILFARAYKKQEEVLEDTLDQIEGVREEIERVEEVSTTLSATPEEQARMLMPLYGAAAGKMIRLYAPPVLMAGSALWLILRSHGVMKGRNQALFAALQLAEGAFSQYRKRVIEDAGEDADARYMYGAEERTTTTVEVVDGKKVKSKAKHLSMGETPSGEMYARLFDETAPNWTESKLKNRHYIEGNQMFFNNMLNAYGFVFLNDVYDAMHMPRNRAGAVVGWSLTQDGDNFIDFGLDKAINNNPTDPRFMMDFNVNGYILDSIPE